MKADYEFHRAIAAASGNPFYSDCLASLGPTMIAMPRARLLMDAASTTRAEHFDQVVHEHESIVAAIAEGDGPSSSAAMRSHLANSRRRLRAVTAAADPGPAIGRRVSPSRYPAMP